MKKQYLVNYDLGYSTNRAFFWNEETAMAFVEAIKPLQKKGDLLQVFTVDAYESNFYKQ